MLLWPVITVRQLAHFIRGTTEVTHPTRQLSSFWKNTLLSPLLPQICLHPSPCTSPSDLFLSFFLNYLILSLLLLSHVRLDSSNSHLFTSALSTFSSLCPFHHKLTLVKYHKVQLEPLCISVFVTSKEIAVNSSLCWRAPSFPLSVNLCFLYDFSSFSYYLCFCLKWLSMISVALHYNNIIKEKERCRASLSFSEYASPESSGVQFDSITDVPHNLTSGLPDM